MAQLHVIGTTFFKKINAQSSRLPSNEKVAVNAGETLKYNPDSLKVVGEHYLVELLEQIASWGTTGYFYSPHVQLEVSGFANRLVRKVLSDDYWDILRIAERIRGGTDNTCVAFASEVLRRMGIPVPIENVQINSETLNISLVTLPFKIWLEQNVSPRRINDADKLRPGDICFSTDEPGFPGFPAHVYFFIEYSPGDIGAAHVVDNQGPKHPRNLDNGRPYKSPFAFALRVENQFEEIYDPRELVEKSFLEASETLREQLMLNQAFE